MNQELKNKRYNYLTKIYVMFELVKAMKNREVAFIHRKDDTKVMRGFWIKSVEYLKKFFECYDIFTEDYNIYISVAHYYHIPPFTLKLSERSNETRVWFQNEAHKLTIDYDILLDIDNKCEITLEEYKYYKLLNKNVDMNGKKYFLFDFQMMYLELKQILDLLNSYDIKYYIIPSGNNFQIHIENNNTFTNEEIKTITTKLNLRYKFICLAGIGTQAKLMKCPYGIVGERVSLPMTTLKYFEYINMDCNKILQSEQIQYRGIPTTNHLLDVSKNLKRFVTEEKLL